MFLDVNIHGCYFHYSQAIMRKAKSIGLTKKKRHRRLIKNIIAAALLPAEHIAETFTILENNHTSSKYKDMFNYLKRTWLVKPFVPSTWSQFGRATRTNNDVEGWHNRFNHRAFNNTAPTFYRLVEELFKESSVVELTFQLVSLERLTRRQRKETATAQGKLFSLWAQYEQGQLSTEAMLKQCQQLVVASFD